MIEFNAMTMSILKDRYLKKDPKTGEILETPEQMFRRVSQAVSKGDKLMEATYFHMMTEGDFLPNTPTLVSAGRPKGQLSACFVLPVEDSMDGIFSTLHDAAMIHKTGGGTGFSFSRLRHKGAPVYSTQGTSSGIMAFLHAYNAATDSVKQGGVRRGANMGMLNISHPDIEEFITSKDDTGQLNNFNLSVAITDSFMQHVTSDLDWDLVNPAHGEVVKTVKAADLWNKIVHQAWKNGEPGVIFIDEMNRHNPNSKDGIFEATNPCGEQPLLPYESCNLGSINIMNHLHNKQYGLGWEIDYDKLEATVKNAVDFLNGVIDVNHFPFDKIKEATLKTRKIGLGIMGWADTLLKLEVRYGSEESLRIAKQLMHFINDKGHKHSEEMGYGNATITTIAPTGTISMIAGVSSGIEPNFAWVYKRKVNDEYHWVLHPLLEKVLKRRKLDPDVKDLILNGIPFSEINGLEDLADVWKTSSEIHYMEHIDMQAAFQEFTDNAVSKTINMDHSVTEVEVHAAYMYAFRQRCKGLTVYRDGSREAQVLNKVSPDVPVDVMGEAALSAQRERPELLMGETAKNIIGCGKLYVTINSDQDGPMEIFTNTGKAGGCPSQSEGLARIVSIALRYNVPIEELVSQLKGIRCMSCIRKEGCHVLSCPDAMARHLQSFIHKEEEPAGWVPRKEISIVPPAIFDTSHTGTCPKCNASMQSAEGCLTCLECGYSHCS